MSRGFTLVETLVGVTIFLIVALGIAQSFSASSKLALLARAKMEAALLANQQFELARNLPYDSVGLAGGIPPGVLPRSQVLSGGGVTFYATTTIRNIDDSFDGTIDGSPHDTSAADYKQMTVTLACANCSLSTPFVFTAIIAPKSLENISNNGAIFLSVIDSAGMLVPEASINIKNLEATPVINIDEVSDNNGRLELVGVPPGTNAYAVTVTKAGYSTDQTYPITLDNPNPTQPHLNVVAGAVTAKTFTIDRVGDLAVRSVNSNCAAVANFPFRLTGKLIGTNPSVYKYDQSFTTDASGAKMVGNLEWDNYDFQPAGTSYDIAGSAPFLPVALSPGATQEVTLFAVSHVPRLLLVIVKDAVTGAPLSEATVTLKKGSTTVGTQTTNRGALSQTDWAGGAGQTDFGAEDRYFTDDGNLNVSAAGEVKLKRVGSSYVSSGQLTSSTFDTGAGSTFYSLTWNPQNQLSQTTLRFQLATATTSTASTTWNFLGPDGTAATYYTTTNGNINAGHSGDRYLRYQAYLSSSNSSRTPTLSDLKIVYGSGCLPYGQVYWNGLVAGTNYQVVVSRTGYQTKTISNLAVSPNWQKLEVALQPN